MQIRFISTLTAEDEARLAEMIVDTAKALLAHSPLGYMLRIETTDAKLFEHNKVAPSATVSGMPRRRPLKDESSAPGLAAIDYIRPKDN